MPVVGKQNALLIQCALPIEARAVAARLSRSRKGSLGLFRAWEGQFGGVPVLVVASGMGVSEAGIAVQEMVRMFEPCGIVDFGTAGALSESWPIGQCALVERAYAYETPVVIPSAPPPQPPPVAETVSFGEWLKMGRDSLSMRTVGIGSADQPVLNPHLAHYLSNTFPFDWVDCESHAVLTTAAHLEVPAIGLRTVTDYCGWDADAQFRNNAGRALRGAARALEKFAVALYEGGLLTA